MTVKQAKLLKEMYEVMDFGMDFGKIGKKKQYTNWEASQLISLNQDIYYLITSEGQCTFRQYKKLWVLAGRQPKLERHMITYNQAQKWIDEYSKKQLAV